MGNTNKCLIETIYVIINHAELLKALIIVAKMYNLTSSNNKHGKEKPEIMTHHLHDSFSHFFIQPDGILHIEVHVYLCVYRWWRNVISDHKLID